MARNKPEQRRRVSPEDVRNNAKEGGGGKNFFRLPPGVRMWEPSKAATYPLDFLPYVVTSDRHPDKMSGVEPGMLWYKLPFVTYRNVGSSNITIVSPSTFGLPCPIAEERARLALNWEANKEKIKALGKQDQVAFAIIDPDDKEKIAIFCMSAGKFYQADSGLEKELMNGGDDNLNFYDVTADGRTLLCRFFEDKFEGRGFIKCDRIDFKPRPAMDEEKILAKVPDLDACLSAMILPYDKLQKLFLQIDDKKPAAAGTTTAPRAPAAAAPAAAAGPAAAAKWKDGDRVSWQDGTVERVGTVDDVDDDDITVKGDDGKEYEVDADDLTVYTPPAAAAPVAAASPAFAVGQEVQKDDGTFHGTITKIKGDSITVKDAAGVKQVIDLDDLEPYVPAPVAAPAAAAAPAGGELRVGMFVRDTSDDTTGTIEKIDGDDVTIKDAKGAKSIVDLDDLVAETAAASGAAAATMVNFLVGSPVTWDDGDESGFIVKFSTKGDKVTVKTAAGVEVKVPVAELAHAAAAAPVAAVAKPLVVGGKCSWDDGDEEGTVVKIKPDKIKVKGDDGESWQPVADVVAL